MKNGNHFKISTAISHVDPKGDLTYRGYSINDLYENKKTFEEVAYLIWYNQFPNKDELNQFKQALNRSLTLSEDTKKFIAALPANLPPLDVLISAISAISLNETIDIVGKIPMIIAYYHYKNKPVEMLSPDSNFSLVEKYFTMIFNKFFLENSKKEIEPKPNLSFVENYFYLIFGKEPAQEQKLLLETYFILTIDHEVNASAFGARVAGSTKAPLKNALIAGFTTLTGPLHGGALPEVRKMGDEIGNSDNISKWIGKKLKDNEKIMGFGHAVYRDKDPRAQILKNLLLELYPENERVKFYGELEEEALKQLRLKKPNVKFCSNIEFWAAAVFDILGFPPELLVPTFATSRTFGYIAHINEQKGLIRPKCTYTGSERTIETTNTDLFKNRQFPICNLIRDYHDDLGERLTL